MIKSLLNNRIIRAHVNVVNVKLSHAISFCNIKDINLDGIDSLLNSNNLSTSDDLVSYYNNGLNIISIVLLL